MGWSHSNGLVVEGFEEHDKDTRLFRCIIVHEVYVLKALLVQQSMHH